MPTSPNVMNYHIGKGIVTFKETGATGTAVDLGNAPSFVYTPKVTKLEHFSSREGVKTKDFTAITEIGAMIKITLDEITAENLAFFTLGDVDATVPGSITIAALKKTEFVGVMSVAGTNDVGQQVDWTGTVSFVPSADFSFITDKDEFSKIELEAEVQKDDTDGSFGTWTIRDPAVAGP